MKILKKKYKNGKEKIYFLGILVRKREVPLLNEAHLNKINFDIAYTKEGEPKNILIFAADSIGDYILMRNFFAEIKNSPKYINAKLTLIASSTIKNIPEYLDAGIFDNILYIPHMLFRKSYYEQYEEINKLFSNGLNKVYDIILFPSHNVNVFRYIQDVLISKIQAKEIIGTTGDLELNDNQHFLQYTRVIPVEHIDFEYKLNKNFFEIVLDKKIDSEIPFINIPKIKNTEKYAVICIGAQDNFRKWHLRNYAQIVSYLQNNKQMRVYLIGAKSEIDEMQTVNKLSGEKSAILAGKDYKDIFEIINNATLYIGNDSGFFHVAVALRTKAICISCGGAYPRFIKYPKSEDYNILVNDIIMKIAQQNYENEHKASYYAEINSVTVDDVKTTVNQLLGE